MKISFDTKTAKTGALVVFAESGAKFAGVPRGVEALLKKAAKAEGFEGKKGQSLAVPAPDGGHSHVVALGLGKVAELGLADFEKMGSGLVPLLNARKAAEVAIAFDVKGLKKLAPEQAAAQMAAGMLLNSYRFDKYLTKEPKEKKPTLKKAGFALKEAAKAKKLFSAHEKIATGVFLTRDLVSEAPNVLYPGSFAKAIQKEMSGLRVRVKVLDEKDLKKQGLGALLAVGQGSAKDRQPRLVIMEYSGGKKGQKPIAFVGKGVTFDTGGISIKPAAGMEDMKWDMGGAGAVTGLMKTLAGRKARVNVVGVVALAENMPSGEAYRPGDVLKSMSGQTIEVLNTDAEGRLCLCDALWYCQEKYKPTHIVDLATLTGAMLVALGHEFAGCFSNDDKLADGLIAAGRDTGELLWRMPLCDEWDKALESPIADMKNIGGRYAGSGTAAHFLKRFIKDGVKWAHLDIAGMAWAYGNKTSVPKGASGFGVRLLDRYVADFWEK